MKLDVVTHEEHEKALKRIADLERTVKGLADGGGAPAREYLTPKEVARRFGIDNNRVYADLDSGRLRAEVRPGKGHARTWRISPDAARAWYEAFVAAGTNQGGRS